MSNLTVGFAIIGGLLLAGILAHGAWSTRRGTPKRPLATSKKTINRISDAFLPSDPAPDLPNQPSSDGAQAATGPIIIAEVAANAKAHSVEKRPHLNPLLDCIVPISCRQTVHGAVAVAAFPSSLRCGSKPFAIEGENLRSKRWEQPISGQEYSAFRTGLQMANRSGAMNEIEFSEFIFKTQNFVDRVEGDADFPDMLEEIAKARELDQFSSDHDVQLGFIIRAREGTWSPSYIQQNALAYGFIPGSIAGRFVLPAKEEGQAARLALTIDPQAVLASEDKDVALQDFRITLDVPQVEREANAFSMLCEAAKVLGRNMEGEIVDEQGQRIRQETLNAIGKDLTVLYNALEARQFGAGSPLARRLFTY